MSNSSNTQHLGEAIQEMLKLSHLSDKIDKYNLIHAWEEVVGGFISKHTTKIDVSDKKLTVTVDSSALRSELFYSRTKLVEDINAKMGKKLIDEIIIR
jgi:predicted nucleic acid-binding Zn ribbon protein